MHTEETLQGIFSMPKHCPSPLITADILCHSLIIAVQDCSDRGGAHIIINLRPDILLQCQSEQFSQCCNNICSISVCVCVCVCVRACVSVCAHTCVCAQTTDNCTHKHNIHFTKIGLDIWMFYC